MKSTNMKEALPFDGILGRSHGLVSFVCGEWMNTSELVSYYTLPQQIESAKESNSHAAYATHLFFLLFYLFIFIICVRRTKFSLS